MITSSQQIFIFRYSGKGIFKNTYSPAGKIQTINELNLDSTLYRKHKFEYQAAKAIETVYDKNGISYSKYKYDAKGNWIYRVKTQDGDVIAIEERKITY